MRLSPGSACLVFRFDNRHFKLAATPRARRGLLRETRGTAQAARDEFWSHYLQPARYRLGFIKHAALCEPADDAALSMVLSAVQQRIGAHLPASGGWNKYFPSLAAIADPRDCWPQRMNDIFDGEICASTHGDLCMANCLLHDGKPVLIDWGNFRPHFWAPYDVLHPEVVRRTNATDTSWLTDLQQQVGENSCDVMQTIRYVICRVELEADQDIAMGRLDDRRRAKHADALSWAGALLKP
ncbi:MAG: hypothetical protein HKN28_04045 [Alphaproteobacteria bacterium]|nr:hypothetical protein [Alphaproteobacteria bacterium]